MNHTQRIAHVARKQRKLTKAVVKESVELYLEALANEIVSGEWIDIKGIGKIQVNQEEVNVMLISFGKDGERMKRNVTHRLRTRFRLYRNFKKKCRKN